jgi:hypothetical protein
MIMIHKVHTRYKKKQLKSEKDKEGDFYTNSSPNHNIDNEFRKNLRVSPTIPNKAF